MIENVKSSVATIIVRTADIVNSEKCRRLHGFVTEAVCEKCLTGYLMSRARRELRKELQA